MCDDVLWATAREQLKKRCEKSGSPAGVLPGEERLFTRRKTSWLSGRLSPCCLLPFCPAGGPGAWSRCEVLLSGLVWPCRLDSSSRSVFSPFLKRGDDPGHRAATTQGPIFSQVTPSTHCMTVVLVVAAGYLLWSYYLFFLSSSFSSPVCSNPPRGAGGRTSTCRAFVFPVFFSWCSRSSSQVVYADESFDLLLCCPSE